MESIVKLFLPPQTILIPSPVLIIGTCGPNGSPNIMTAAWGGTASSKPACISVSLREATLSYHNIKQTEAFNANHIKASEEIMVRLFDHEFL